MSISDTSQDQQVIPPETLEIFAKVNNKGQITIPKQIRENFGINKNSQIFISGNGEKQQLTIHLTGLKDKSFKPIKVSKTYRFTIPKEGRNLLRLEGTSVIFKASQNQQIIIEKATYQTVTRAERLWIAPNETLAHLCYLAKNLYNEATYIIRQGYFKTKLWTRYEELNSLLKYSPNYKGVSAKTAQQLLRHVDSVWDSYFKSHREWLVNPHKYTGEPRLPK